MGDKAEREWSSGAFSCLSDIKSCICGLCCPWCVTCRVAERMGEPCTCCLGLLFPESMLALRVKARTQHGIRGDICNDLICSTFCASCTLCQLDRELTAMGL